MSEPRETDLAARFREAMAELPVTLAAPSELVAELSAIAARFDFQAFTGRIAAVGQFTTEYPYGGWLYVTFADDGGNGGGRICLAVAAVVLQSRPNRAGERQECLPGR